MQTQDKYLWVVNKNQPFNEEQLQDFTFSTVRDSDGKTYIETQTEQAYLALREHMIENFGIALYLTSAGRTIQTQQKVFDEYRAEHTEEETLKTVALPGTSEHHTGLALDVKPEIAHSAFIQAIIDKLPLPERIAYLKQPDIETKKLMYQTLHQELEQFGFIVRYTQDKQDITGVKSEPWHIRYVGVENAKAINASGLCLEEYVEQIQSQQEAPKPVPAAAQ